MRRRGRLDRAADAVLVQLGDLIDRGPSMRGTLDFVMALERTAGEARRDASSSLLGNHEVMNMTGDLRYVAAANYAEFADAGSEKRRDDAWLQVRRPADAARPASSGRPSRRPAPRREGAWLDAHPPGFLEHQEAFGPDGVYGRWLRARSAIRRRRGDRLSPRRPLAGPTPEMLAATSSTGACTRISPPSTPTASSSWREGLILPFFDFAGDDARRPRGARRASARGKDVRAAQGLRALPRLRHGWTMNSPDGPLWFRGLRPVERRRGRRGDAAAAVGGGRRALRRRPHGSAQDGHIRVRFDGTASSSSTPGCSTRRSSREAGPRRSRSSDGVVDARSTRASRAGGSPSRAPAGRRPGCAGPREEAAHDRTRSRGSSTSSGGDGRRGALLFAYLFLIITCYQLGKTARDALFLSVFKASKLPYADMAIALSVGVVIAAYVTIGRRVRAAQPARRLPAALRRAAVRLLVPGEVPSRS